MNIKTLLIYQLILELPRMSAIEAGLAVFLEE